MWLTGPWEGREKGSIFFGRVGSCCGAVVSSASVESPMVLVLIRTRFILM